MAANKIRYAQGENISDTLSTSIGAGDTTIPVSTIAKWSSNGGCVIIDRNASTEEIIVCTGVSGSSLVVASSGRGFDATAAQGHNAGATIESVPLAKDWNDVIDTLKNIFKVADGNIDITLLGTSEYVVDTGSANAYACTLVPTLASYSAGTVVRFKAANANTTTSTLNVNGLGVKTIKKLDGATNLSANDIASGQLVVCVYDGTNFQLVSPSGIQVNTTDTQTLTNKRVTKRTASTTSSATPTPNSDTTDEYILTALAAGATFGAPTGTPTEGQPLLVRVKDNGSAQTLAFNAIYRFSTDLSAPTTTVINKTLYMLFVYNNTDTKWDCVGTLNNF